MSRLYLAGAAAEADEPATRRWYAGAPQWDCDCGHCRNFLALARRRQLPPEVLELQDRLEIPPEKATYVCEMYHEETTLFYQIGYRLAGTLLEAAPGSPEAGYTEIHISRERCAPFEAPDFPEPSFELELWISLPWILDEPIDGREENAP